MIRPHTLFLVFIYILSSALLISAQDYQMMTVDVDVADVKYWESADRLVVCTNTDTTYGNSLLIVNPYTGQIESSIFIGSLPSSLDISLDEKWAYVGISGANRVVRCDLEKLEIDQTIMLGTDTNTSLPTTFTPGLIVCSRQSPSRFAIFRGLNSPLPRYPAVYENGINLHEMPASFDYQSLAFGSTDQLYAGKPGTLSKLSTSGSKIVIEEAYNFSPANFSQMTYLEDHIYSKDGFKIDISGTPTLVHEFQLDCGLLNRPVVTAVTDSAVYLIGNRYDAFGRHCMRIVSNFEPYDEISAFPLFQRISAVNTAIPWGDNNLAMKVMYRNDTRFKLAIFRKCVYNSNIIPVLNFDGIAGGCIGELVTLTADSSFDNVFWSTGEYAHEVHIPLNMSGDHFYQVADSNGCLSPPSNVLNIDFGARPDIPVIIPDLDTIEICTGETVVLRTSNGGFSVNHWSDGSRGSTLSVDTAGLYTMQFITTEGCIQPVLDSIVVIQRPDVAPAQPVLNPSKDTMLCSDNILTVLAPSGFAEYNWMVLDDVIITDSNSITLNGADFGLTPVSVQVFDEHGCHSERSKNVIVRFIHPFQTPTISASGNTLTASGFGVYRWYLNGEEITGESGKSITVTQPGFYQAENISDGCPTDKSQPYNFQ